MQDTASSGLQGQASHRYGNFEPSGVPAPRYKNRVYLQGMTVGVDAMCWMHRGAIACASDLVLTGKPGTKFIQFVMKMVYLLLENGIRPILVFDGNKTPVKATEDASRSQRREKAKEKSKKLLSAGVSLEDKKLRSLMTQAIRVTNDMITRVMEALRRAGVEFLVAPYEADAQLAYLCRVGVVDAVITEDSDLLAYGCPRVIFKLNLAGDAQEIDLPEIIQADYDDSDLLIQTQQTRDSIQSDCKADVQGKSDEDVGRVDQQTLPSRLLSSSQATLDEFLNRPEEIGSECLSSAKEGVEAPKMSMAEHVEKKSKQVTLVEELRRFNWPMFVAMCVLSGCDYTHDVHVSGWGIQAAFTLVKRYKTLESVFRHAVIDPRLAKRIRRMYPTASLIDGSTTAEGFSVFEAASSDWKTVVIKHIVAAVVFMHQRVYDPRMNCIVAVNDTKGSHDTSSKTPSIIVYGKFRFEADAILGPVERDGWRLFRHVSGHDSEMKAIHFSAAETSAITAVQHYNSAHLRELQQLSCDMKDRLHLRRFQFLFGNKSKSTTSEKEAFCSTSSIRAPCGGGTGLMERLYLERTQQLADDTATENVDGGGGIPCHGDQKDVARRVVSSSPITPHSFNALRNVPSRRSSEHAQHTGAECSPGVCASDPGFFSPSSDVTFQKVVALVENVPSISDNSASRRQQQRRLLPSSPLDSIFHQGSEKRRSSLFDEFDESVTSPRRKKRMHSRGHTPVPPPKWPTLLTSPTPPLSDAVLQCQSDHSLMSHDPVSDTPHNDRHPIDLFSNATFKAQHSSSHALKFFSQT